MSKYIIIIGIFVNLIMYDVAVANDRSSCIKEHGKVCFGLEVCNLEPLTFSEKKRVKHCKTSGGETGACIINLREISDDKKICLRSCFDEYCPLTE
ncbi:MAG: hypothetical protein HOM96_05650 [Rickettsiales bacterium]|jgi:hypothetical protein|nr:hypothetical protein [Rickettsiales bacterium]